MQSSYSYQFRESICWDRLAFVFVLYRFTEFKIHVCNFLLTLWPNLKNVELRTSKDIRNFKNLNGRILQFFAAFSLDEYSK